MKKNNLKSRLLNVTLDAPVLFDPLSSTQMKKITGGVGYYSDDLTAFASGETKTSSGQQCDGTAVCNCNCKPNLES